MFTQYNYLEEMIEEIKEYTREKYPEFSEDTRNEIENELIEDCCINENFTGNITGSYTCNRGKAEEYLAGNTDLLYRAITTYDQPLNILESPEACDVLIRCYLLQEAVECALDELEDE